MRTEEQPRVDPIIKLIKDRESLYFQVLAFVNKNIESSSNDFDQIYIFNKFLTNIKESEIEQNQYQNDFLQSFLKQSQNIEIEKKSDSKKGQKKSKQMMRILARVEEIFEDSIQKVRKSLFNENGKLEKRFQKLKKQLRKIVKKDKIDLHDFSSLILNFSRNKYKMQILKLQKYVSKLEVGDLIFLRDMYGGKDQSDVSPSPEDKIKQRNLTHKKISKEEDNVESPQKRGSVKKVNGMGIRPKRNLAKKRDESVGSDKVKEQKPDKKTQVNKLYKFYSFMEINKKEFLEDYMFEKQVEEEQSKKLFNNLIQKNKLNGEQINIFYKKIEGKNPQMYTLPNPSSDENHSSSAAHNGSKSSRTSLKPSFKITTPKRKPSYQHSYGEKSEIEAFQKDFSPCKTAKNITQRNKKAVSQTPRKANTSRPIFIQKQMMVFDDEFLPKAPPTQTQWIHQPLTGRDRSRRNQNLRLKKKNNPYPLESNCLPESFNFTQYPI